MPEPTAASSPTTDHADEPANEVIDTQATTDELVDQEILVEEISIDGMCGVY